MVYLIVKENLNTALWIHKLGTLKTYIAPKLS